MFKYGTSFVDERYSSIVEPLLYADNIFQPGITYTDRYASDAGLEQGSGIVKVHKLKMTDCDVQITGKNDFSNEDTEDEIIDIALNNSFMKSIKLYSVVAAAVSYQMQMEYYDTLVNKVRNAWTAAAVACLVSEGTYVSYSSEHVDKPSLYEDVLSERVKVRYKNGDANVVLCSPETFAEMLAESKQAYTPAFNDAHVTQGSIARMMIWNGFLWVETSFLGGGAGEARSLAYVQYNGTTNTKRNVQVSKVRYVLYNPNAFSIIDNLNVMRIVDTNAFPGSLAQIAINSGFKVTNTDLVVVRHVTTGA